jgi:hypothetical protein
MSKDGSNSSAGLPFALLEAGGAIGAALAIGAFQLVKGQWRRQREQDEQDERDCKQLQGRESCGHDVCYLYKVTW